MTAYANAKEYILVTGVGQIPNSSNVALSIYIPKAAITETPTYWQVTDCYNNGTAIHMQCLCSTTSGASGLYYGIGIIAGSVITYYYR